MVDILQRIVWYNLADANRALDEYFDAFGSIKDFLIRGTDEGEREDEAIYAARIRRAISTNEPMTEEQILEMYGIVYDEDSGY